MKKILLLVSIIIIVGCNSKKSNNKIATVEILKEDTPINKIKLDSKIKTLDVIQADTTFVLSVDRSIEDYKKNIKKVYKLMRSDLKIKNHYIESTISLNENEHLFFYSLSYSYSEEDIQMFDTLNRMILDEALFDKGICLKLFSNLAEFVDGEYADYYFDEMYFVASKNAQKFCDLYNNLSKVSIDRLTDVYKEICL